MSFFSNRSILQRLFSLYRISQHTMSSESGLTIGTHDGNFHCDEALACFMIKLLPQYKDARIIRTREECKLNSCDIVVDVGSIYDFKKNRFDHHQPSFTTKLSELFSKKTFGNVKLSSAGLIYGHFGHEIISQICDWSKDDPKTDKVFDMVYENLIKEVDAIDNGINMYEGEPLYKISTHLSARVSRLTPDWNEPSNDEILYERFLLAVDVTGKEFLDRVHYYGHTWMSARMFVLEDFNKRFTVHSSGRIVVLNNLLPWIQHLFEIEEELNCTGQTYYVIFPDAKGWRVRAVPLSYGNFQLRKAICKDWLGLRSDELCKVSGIDGCTFVHNTGFIGGNNTLQGAIDMATKSLNS